MDSKSNVKVNMASDPPVYKFIPRVPKDRKQIILISVVLVLLATIIIGAILIGVYLTQQHIERVIKTISNGSDGEVVEQTVMVNNQENVAAFHIHSNLTTATVVYDYKNRLIGFRIHDRRQCLVVAMDSVDVPSLNEITQGIEHFDKQISGDDSLAYSFEQGKLADQTILGTTVNILCSDVPVYWAEKMHKEQRGGLIPCLGLLILNICFRLLLPTTLDFRLTKVTKGREERRPRGKGTLAPRVCILAERAAIASCLQLLLLLLALSGEVRDLLLIPGELPDYPQPGLQPRTGCEVPPGSPGLLAVGNRSGEAGGNSVANTGPNDSFSHNPGRGWGCVDDVHPPGFRLRLKRASLIPPNPVNSIYLCFACLEVLSECLGEAEGE
ncbi:uncharacterized protein LOC134407555 [Elgaria multicarinata webbii]|uniref:uncharacterized protein LOC134407555 n=1 Tax=Elgaria multicarinata webbii TaxID=159646 RepID=UPI002FCD0257